MQPTREGVNSRIVCQPSVMILCLPCQREDTNTIGPGSRYRRTWLTGKSSFGGCFTPASSALARRLQQLEVLRAQRRAGRVEAGRELSGHLLSPSLEITRQ